MPDPYGINALRQLFSGAPRGGALVRVMQSARRGTARLRAAGLAAWVAGAGLVLSPAVTASAAPMAIAGSPAVEISPSPAVPGTAATFAVRCGSAASSAVLSGRTLGLAEHISMRAGWPAGWFTVTVTLPDDIKPGVHTPVIYCSGGSSARARLRVSPLLGPGTGGGGAGASMATGNALTIVGLALLGIGAISCGAIIRRRSGTRSWR